MLCYAILCGTLQEASVLRSVHKVAVGANSSGVEEQTGLLRSRVDYCGFGGRHVQAA